MLEIAGIVIAGMSLANDLVGRYQDSTKWAVEDLRVDADWLPLALAKGLIVGEPNDFGWTREERVATRELSGTAQKVLAFNNDTRTKYRLCWGQPGDYLILMKKTASA